MCSVDSVVFADFTTIQMFVFVLCIITRTITVLRPFVRDYLDESVPEETFTHSPILIIVQHLSFLCIRVGNLCKLCWRRARNLCTFCGIH